MSKFNLIVDSTKTYSRTFNQENITLTVPNINFLITKIEQTISLNIVSLEFKQPVQYLCDNMSFLLKILPYCPFLKKIKIAINNNDNKFSAPFFEVISKLPKLEDLDLSESNFVLWKSDPLINYLSSKPKPPLKILNLSKSSLSELDIFGKVINHLIDNRSLTSLDISYIGSRQDKDAAFSKIISELLKCNNVIKSLNLAYNGINDKGIEYLKEGIKSNKVIEALELKEIPHLFVNRALEQLQTNKLLPVVETRGFDPLLTAPIYATLAENSRLNMSHNNDNNEYSQQLAGVLHDNE